MHHHSSASVREKAMPRPTAKQGRAHRHFDCQCEGYLAVKEGEIVSILFDDGPQQEWLYAQGPRAAGGADGPVGYLPRSVLEPWPTTGRQLQLERLLPMDFQNGTFQASCAAAEGQSLNVEDGDEFDSTVFVPMSLHGWFRTTTSNAAALLAGCGEVPHELELRHELDEVRAAASATEDRERVEEAEVHRLRQQLSRGESQQEDPWANWNHRQGGAYDEIRRPQRHYGGGGGGGRRQRGTGKFREVEEYCLREVCEAERQGWLEEGCVRDLVETRERLRASEQHSSSSAAPDLQALTQHLRAREEEAEAQLVNSRHREAGLQQLLRQAEATVSEQLAATAELRQELAAARSSSSQPQQVPPPPPLPESPPLQPAAAPAAATWGGAAAGGATPAAGAEDDCDGCAAAAAESQAVAAHS